MAKVEALPNSPCKCSRCGKPLAVQSIDPTGWITMVPHECTNHTYPWPMCPRCGCEKNACVCSPDSASREQEKT